VQRHDRRGPTAQHTDTIPDVGPILLLLTRSILVVEGFDLTHSTTALGIGRDNER
jgi:hypothetical protein